MEFHVKVIFHHKHQYIYINITEKHIFKAKNELFEKKEIMHFSK